MTERVILTATLEKVKSNEQSELSMSIWRSALQFSRNGRKEVQGGTGWFQGFIAAAAATIF